LFFFLTTLLNRKHIKPISMPNDKIQMSNEFQSSHEGMKRRSINFKQIRNSGMTILDFDLEIHLHFTAKMF